MKLKNQLNLSFLILIVCLLSITALLFYMLSFQFLVKDQKQELQARGKAWVKVAIKEDQVLYQQDLRRLERIPLKSGKVEVVLYAPKQKSLMYSSFNPAKTRQVIPQLTNSYPKGHQGLLTIANQKYITIKFRFLTKTNQPLIFMLSTPIKGIKMLQAEFTRILLWLLLISGVIVFILNDFITRRLLHPLTQVNDQLKKVEKRQFKAIDEIHAKGEIGEVAHNTYRMAQELQQYIESQKQFFQNASHELKTPLMSIQGFAEGILDGVFEGDQESHALNMIVAESERIKNLVNEMLTLAKLESYEEHYETEVIEVGVILTDAVNRVIPLAEQKKIKIEIGEIERGGIQANQERLLQGIINLLENGIRYAKAHVRIRSHIEEGFIRVIIEDDGSGLPESLLPRLFHRFVKGEGGQNGLGLAITRAIIEKAEGEVWAENRSGGGARFIVQLPLIKKLDK